MLQFRDMELDFDLYDADNAETYEVALDNFSDAAKKIPATGTLAGSTCFVADGGFYRG